MSVVANTVGQCGTRCKTLAKLIVANAAQVPNNTPHARVVLMRFWHPDLQGPSPIRLRLLVRLHSLICVYVKRKPCLGQLTFTPHWPLGPLPHWPLASLLPHHWPLAHTHCHRSTDLFFSCHRQVPVSTVYGTKERNSVAPPTQVSAHSTSARHCRRIGIYNICCI